MMSLPCLFMILVLAQFTDQYRYACNSKALCGCSVEWAIVAKIVGGEAVRSQSWGWIVSLTYAHNNQHFCGGSILSSTWILTAAHCVFQRDASDIIINAGSNKLYDGTQQRQASKIILYPYYHRHTYANDIALILLSSPLDMNDIAIDKICLPRPTGKNFRMNFSSISSKKLLFC